jgi:hypothetical protein
MAKYDDIGITYTKDSLNLHDGNERVIYVLRKTGHYDILYKDHSFKDHKIKDYSECDKTFINTCLGPDY